MEFVDLLNQVLSTETIFLVLFVYLFYFTRKEGKEREDSIKTESKERENKLFEQLQKSDDRLDSITITLEKINNDILDIKTKL